MAYLAVRHLVDFFAPPPWIYHRWDRPAVRSLAAVLVPVLDVIGLIGLAFGAWQGWRLYRPLLAFVVATALPYALVEPLPRYTYCVYGILAFAAARLLTSLWSARPGAGSAR